MMLAFLHHLSSNRSKVNNYLHLVNPKNLLLLRYILLIRISKWKIEVISIEVDSFMASLENAENMLIFPNTEMQNANMYPKYVFFLIALEQMLPTFRKAFPTIFFILQYCIKCLSMFSIISTKN